MRQVCASKRVWLLGGTPKEVDSKSGPAADGARLTPKEREILALLLEGYSNGRIAEALCVSITTVKTHVAHVFRKFGVSSRKELFMAGGRMS
jgi:DNA-binding CsgD family transcriptional regulator